MNIYSYFYAITSSNENKENPVKLSPQRLGSINRAELLKQSKIYKEKKEEIMNENENENKPVVDKAKRVLVFDKNTVKSPLRSKNTFKMSEYSAFKRVSDKNDHSSESKSTPKTISNLTTKNTLRDFGFLNRRNRSTKRKITFDINDDNESKKLMTDDLRS